MSWIINKFLIWTDDEKQVYVTEINYLHHSDDKLRQVERKKKRKKEQSWYITKYRTLSQVSLWKDAGHSYLNVSKEEEGSEDDMTLLLDIGQDDTMQHNRTRQDRMLLNYQWKISLS